MPALVRWTLAGLMLLALILVPFLLFENHVLEFADVLQDVHEFEQAGFEIPRLPNKHADLLVTYGVNSGLRGDSRHYVDSRQRNGLRVTPRHR